MGQDLTNNAYFALELTKLVATTSVSKKQCQEMFDFFIKNLGEYKSISKLTVELNKVKEENERLKLRELGMPYEQVVYLSEIIDKYQGDMEPIVYSELSKIIKSNL